jgi:hypothetical protein
MTPFEQDLPTDQDLEEAADMTTPVNLPAPSKAQKTC